MSEVPLAFHESHQANHERFMGIAIEIASRNPAAPSGSILVDMSSDRIVAEGVNCTNANPILHGEIDAIMRYAEIGSNWSSLRLYTTAEPCCMCQAAIIWSGIPEVVFGSSIQTLKRLGWNQFDQSAEQVIASARFASCQIEGGVLSRECDQLFRKAKF